MQEIIVIKIGGVASQNLDQAFIKQVKTWQAAGKKIVIVHGGGYAINALMEEKQVAVDKIDGLRITSKPVLDLVHYALTEIVGKKLVSTLIQSGLDAVQVKEHMAKIVQASFLNQERYGYVGQVDKVKTDYLELMLVDDMIPVLPSLGYSPDGQLLNINADYVATSLAVALKAQQLILMTDVPGVKENGQVLPVLTLKEIEDKIDQEIITDNMIPKVRGAAQAVLDGVEEVMIASALNQGSKIIKGDAHDFSLS